MFKEMRTVGNAGRRPAFVRAAAKRPQLACCCRARAQDEFGRCDRVWKAFHDRSLCYNCEAVRNFKL